MTRLPTLSARKLIQALKRAGFVEEKVRHLALRHESRGLTTCVPIHAGDIKRSLLKEIIRQAGLSENEFMALL